MRVERNQERIMSEGRGEVPVQKNKQRKWMIHHLIILEMRIILGILKIISFALNVIK
jgi:hypothetical protein